MAEQTLGTLTVGWLTKFIKQYIEQYPLSFLRGLSVEELVVSRKLTVSDQVVFTTSSTWRFVGSQGQPAFTNSWVNYGAPYANASFRKMPDGTVLLHGVIKTGTLSSAAFQLPPGFRPSAAVPFIVLSNGVAGRVDVGADGTVTPISPSNNASVVLDQIRFMAA